MRQLEEERQRMLEEEPEPEPGKDVNAFLKQVAVWTQGDTDSFVLCTYRCCDCFWCFSPPSVNTWRITKDRWGFLLL